MKIIGVIPARLGSTRLPEKVLQPIAGQPMIQHVLRRVKQAKRLHEVIVACDDPRILKCVEAAGGRAVMTKREHPNGTSRVAEIAQREKADVFLNIQGDEPMIRPEAIDELAEIFLEDSQVQVATLAVRSSDEENFRNPNVVKVVCDQQGNALYFSRSPVPHDRNGEKPLSFLKHLGIYGYRRDFLLEFVSWKPGALEMREKLEQLRILERGRKIRVFETAFDSVGVDTEEDLEKVEFQIKMKRETV